MVVQRKPGALRKPGGTRQRDDISSLVLGALPTDAFHFSGFLPNAKAARRSALEGLREIPGTLVFYESAKRVAAMLHDAADVLGADRKGAVCRELTKKFEEVQRGTLAELAEYYANRPVKGEIVVLIDRNRSETISEDSLKEDLAQAMSTLSMRDAVDMVAKAHNMPRRQVYQMALELSKG